MAARAGCEYCAGKSQASSDAPYQQAEFAAEPHLHLYVHEQIQWRQLYQRRCKETHFNFLIICVQTFQLTGVFNVRNNKV